MPDKTMKKTLYVAAYNRINTVYGLYQWWRTYVTGARGGTHSPLCGHAQCRSSAEFVSRKVEGRWVRLLPRSGQPSEKALLRVGSLVTLPVLSQEYPLTQHVTSETLPFDNITASYDIIFGNTIMVLDARLLWTFFISKKEG